MAGAYCQYCGQRCFVLRTLPDDATSRAGQSLHLAACAAGAAHDRESTGYDHTTAVNPMSGKPGGDPESSATEGGLFCHACAMGFSCSVHDPQPETGETEGPGIVPADGGEEL
jgi:hypothetical protein